MEEQSDRERAEDELIQRFRDGDNKAIAEVRDRLRSDAVLAVTATYASPATIATDLLLMTQWKNYPQVRSGLRDHMAAMRRDLAAVHSSPLELILIDRIVADWLQSTTADALYERHAAEGSDDLLERLDERRSRAQRRYLSAIKSLADARRLLVPLMQVNVANQQIVANGNPPTAKLTKQKHQKEKVLMENPNFANFPLCVTNGGGI